MESLLPIMFGPKGSRVMAFNEIIKNAAVVIQVIGFVPFDLLTEIIATAVPKVINVDNKNIIKYINNL